MNAAAPGGTPPRRINNREHFLKNTELPRHAPEALMRGALKSAIFMVRV